MHGRLITNNMLIAFETMHHISQKKGGKVGEMALKLDMSKVYDKVWNGCVWRKSWKNWALQRGGYG